jgi:hypothetical protein
MKIHFSTLFIATITIYGSLDILNRKNLFFKRLKYKIIIIIQFLKNFYYKIIYVLDY